MAQSVPGGKSFLSRRSEPAVSFNRISQQKVRSTMSKLRTIGSGAGFDVSQSSGHILWRFCRLPPLSLWDLIKHWTAWGQALAQSEKEKDLFYYPILTVHWINYFISVCEKRLKDFSFRKFNYFYCLHVDWHFICFHLVLLSWHFNSFQWLHFTWHFKHLSVYEPLNLQLLPFIINHF